MDKVNYENFNYDAIKYFISVARLGSLSKAAYSLGISQSALSQSMKNLEQSLDVTLFERNTRGIILTPAGKILYENATIGNDYFENAIIKTIRTKKFDILETFKISISDSLISSFLAPSIKILIKQYPTINFEIVPFLDEYNVVEALQNNEIDLVILKTRDDFISKEIITHPFIEFHYCLTYNPKYFQLDSNLSYKQLNNIPIIMKRRTGREDNSWLKTTFAHIITCDSDETIFKLIKNGTGIGIYPKEIAKKEGWKTIHLKEFPQTKRNVMICCLRSNKIAQDITGILTKAVKA